MKLALICLFVFLGIPSVAIAAPLSQPTPQILYVKAIPTGSANCTSWDNACGLQAALDIAEPGHQVWVAAGTYLPTKLTNSTEPRSATFALETGVEIYGGFPADGGDWDERDSVTHLTRLSGDLGNPGNKADNSFHVITYEEVGATAILDGFTISDGNAIYVFDYFHGIPSDRHGGGIFISNSSPILTNLIVNNNSAESMGGGVFNESSSPRLSNVTFTANSAQAGGGMANYNSAPRLTNVTFNSNYSLVYGGGMYSTFNCIPMLTNVTFSSNHSDREGGGILNESSNSILINVTFYSNTADVGGGAISNYRSNPTITNAILWGNNPAQIFNWQSTTNINYSNIEGGHIGTGNFNLDPQLAPLADNGGLTQTHALGAESPAIDKGDPNNCSMTDQRDFFRPIDGDADGVPACDMGAYEFGSVYDGFSLTAEALGCGTVTKDPSKAGFHLGEIVTLQASPLPGCSFEGWSGDAEGTDNPLLVTVGGSLAFTANFQRNFYVYILFPIYK